MVFISWLVALVCSVLIKIFFVETTPITLTITVVAIVACGIGAARDTMNRGVGQ